MRSKRKILLLVSIVLLVGMIGVGALFYFGVLHLNNPSAKQYPIRGVDVSAYQGEIDWQILSQQGISFAFIKATEGSKYVDPRFSYNWEQAGKTDLRVGAYHFFSFDSAAQTQAANFIQTVPPMPGMLPPVIDVELYGEKKSTPPDRETVLPELKLMLAQLEEAYGVKPIIYATMTAYQLYLADNLAEYDIWIRDILCKPKLSDGRGWRFWQYTDRARLKGYQGEERYIDMNIFSGTESEFAAYGMTKPEKD